MAKTKRYLPREQRVFDRETVDHFKKKIDNDPMLDECRSNLIAGVSSNGTIKRHFGELAATEALVKLAIFVAEHNEAPARRGRDTRSRPTERGIRV